MFTDLTHISIRNYMSSDFPSVSDLFCDTIKHINIRDYSDVQCKAWIANSDKLNKRRARLATQRTLIAEINGKTVGFGSIDDCGYLDMLFVHRDYQHLGIATALCNQLERGFDIITTYSSVTARAFFEKRGYTVQKVQKAICLGCELPNYYMIKKQNDLTHNV